jgi:hypothetical protein
MRMYALVNFKKRLLVSPGGQIFTGLPRTLASVFCFASKDDALRTSKTFISPKFQCLPVNIDSKGFPTAVQ